MKHSFWPLIYKCPVVYLYMKNSQYYLANQIQIKNTGCVLSAWLGKEKHSLIKRNIFIGANGRLMAERNCITSLKIFFTKSMAEQ